MADLFFLLLVSLFQAVADGDIVHSIAPRTWYSDCLSGPANPSSDGRLVLWPIEGRIDLFDAGSNEQRVLSEVLGWDSVRSAQWIPGEHVLEVMGSSNGERRRGFWDLDKGARVAREGKLPEMRIFELLYTRDPGLSYAFARRGEETGLWSLGGDGTARLFAPKVEPRSWAVSHDGRRVAVLVESEGGWSDLWLYEPESESGTCIARDLDTSYQSTPLAFTPGNEAVLISLVAAKRGPGPRYLLDQVRRRACGAGRGRSG
jgi:hypothetical protein